ncbi:MAG TPA: hypothetical protein VFW24_16220 [Acidimicrobiales bacterium]|nr:hypothetical protein [Acidimicrobiales bacterium]
MNPWIAADLLDERVRDLRATAGRAARSGRRTTRGTGARSPHGRRRRPSLAHRALRALTGQRLRPA